ncbi:MAG: AMP-binding protein [Actinobacteria bacterium]|nr:AMP-binding protein [Actinomycetota bacterium]
MNTYDVSDPDRRVIGEVLRWQAERAPDATYLMMDDRRLSFGEVNRLANSYAAGLRKLGVEPGERVSLLMENSLELAVVALAANKLGATWVPTNTTYKGEWLRDTLTDADAALLVVDEALVPRVLELDGDVPVRRAVVFGGEEGSMERGVEWLPFAELDTGTAAEPDVEVSPRDISAVMWTSGTTGRSKGVMQSHACWLGATQVFRRARDVQAGDVLYCCVPMFNSGGWVFNVYEGLADGLPVAIDRQFTVTQFWDRVRHYGATQVVTLGAMHIYLWQAPARPDDRDNPLRVAGFVPVPHELIGPMKERFGLEMIWQGWGQSEAMPATIASGDRSWKPNSAGVARPDMDVRVLDDSDREVPPGEVGELCIRPREPDVLFSGYFRQPEVTLATFRNLWYHTGDLGRMDDDGEIFFVDRKADFMRHKGRNISSFEAERAALAHPEVKEVAAHGVPAAELASEDEVKLCVVRENGATLTEEALAAFVNANAPYYLVPRYIEFVDELPHTPTGRVQKYLLRQRGVTPATWDRVAAGFEVQR